jgi:hypothetical protein
MDAWETLISTSSLTPAGSYDAWEHLNAQSGGGPGNPMYVYTPDPTVIISKFGNIHISGDDNLPNLKVDNALELQPNISSNTKKIVLTTNLLKPSLHIQ